MDGTSHFGKLDGSRYVVESEDAFDDDYSRRWIRQTTNISVRLEEKEMPKTLYCP